MTATVELNDVPSDLILRAPGGTAYAWLPLHQPAVLGALDDMTLLVDVPHVVTVSTPDGATYQVSLVVGNSSEAMFLFKPSEDAPDEVH